MCDGCVCLLQEMETLLQEHDQESRQRVQELGEELVSNSIMPQLVQRDLDDFLRKVHALEMEVRAG